ncbi:MAG: SEL1-like repeat protein [Magnetococcales bacterium]|nr:SEL1-like repeat protein [Magnetococcales bacterium]
MKFECREPLESHISGNTVGETQLTAISRINGVFHKVLSGFSLASYAGLLLLIMLLPAVLVAEPSAPLVPSAPSKVKVSFKQTLNEALAGNIRAQNLLGTMLVVGHETKKDSRAAASWFEITAARGSAEGQLNLGMLYLIGDGVPEDAKKAAKLIKSAALKGHSKAQNLIGYFYEQGIGVNADRNEAVKWFKLASASGSVEAKNNLIRLGVPVPPATITSPQKQKPTPQPPKKNKVLPRSGFVASQTPQIPAIQPPMAPPQISGDRQPHPTPVIQPPMAPPQISKEKPVLALNSPPTPIEDTSKKVVTPEDERKARDLVGTALAVTAKNPTDMVATAGWFYAAALKGDTKSQIELGMMYLVGLGVKESETHAAHYFNLAAQEDDPEAQRLLARLYSLGAGVQHNPAQALKWYMLADGFDYAKAKPEHKLLLSTLTPDQVNWARVEAEKFRTKRTAKLKAIALAKAKARATALRIAEAKRAAAKRLAEYRKSEAIRIAKEKKAEEIRLAEAKRQEAIRLAKEMNAEAIRQAENRKAALIRQAELRKAEAMRIAKLRADKQRKIAAAKLARDEKILANIEAREEAYAKFIAKVEAEVLRKSEAKAAELRRQAEEKAKKAQQIIAAKQKVAADIRAKIKADAAIKAQKKAAEFRRFAQEKAEKAAKELAARKKHAQQLKAQEDAKKAQIKAEIEAKKAHEASLLASAEAKKAQEAKLAAKASPTKKLTAAQEAELTAQADDFHPPQEKDEDIYKLDDDQGTRAKQVLAILEAQSVADIALRSEAEEKAIEIAEKKAAEIRRKAEQELSDEKAAKAKVKKDAQILAKIEAEANRIADEKAAEIRRLGEEKLAREKKILAAIEKREIIAAEKWQKSERDAQEWAKAEMRRREKILAEIEAREIFAANAWEKDSVNYPEPGDDYIPNLGKRRSRIIKLQQPRPMTTYLPRSRTLNVPMNMSADSPMAKTTHLPRAKVKFWPKAKTSSVPKVRAKTKYLDEAIAKANSAKPATNTEIVNVYGVKRPKVKTKDLKGRKSYVFDNSNGVGAWVVPPGSKYNSHPELTNTSALPNGRPPTPRKKIGPLLTVPSFPQVTASDVKRASVVAELGKAALKQNNFVDALAHYRIAYKIDPTNLDHIHNTASLTLAAKEGEQALPIFRQAARLAAVAGKSADAALYNYQITQILSREPEWIDKKLVEVGAITQKKSKVVGELSNLLELAISHAEAGRMPQGINFGRQALVMAQKNLGKSHAVSIMAERQLGEIYLQQGDIAGAKSLFNQAIEHASISLGKNHPETLTIYTLLANLHEQQMDLEEAAEILDMVQTGYDKSLGENHPISLRNTLDLARIYLNIGKADKGEALLRDSCNAYEKTFGFQHSETGECLVQYAASAFAQGEFPVAIANYKQAVEILSGSLSEGSPALLESQAGLAKAYHKQGKIKEARMIIANVIRLGEAKPKDNAKLLDEAHLTQARLLMEAGKSK